MNDEFAEFNGVRIVRNDRVSGMADLIILENYSEDDVPAINDGIGIVEYLENSVGRVEEWGAIDFIQTTVTDALEDADWVMRQMTGGTERETLRLVAGVSATTADILRWTSNTAETNGIVDIMELRLDTTGTAASSFGAGISIQMDDAGGLEEQASIDFLLTTATAGAEDLDIIISQQVAGAITQKLLLNADGLSLLSGGLEIENGTTFGTAALVVDNNDTDQIAVSIEATNIDADVVNITAAALTTAIGIDLPDLDALTTGIGLNINSAATAITGAGRLMYIYHSGATTTSGLIAEIKSDATDETIPMRVAGAGTGDDVVITNANTGALGAVFKMSHLPGNSQAADNDVTNRLIFTAHDEEAAATERTVGQLDIQWTDATAVSYGSDLELYLATGAAQNLCLTLSGAGQMGLDFDSDLSSSSAAGQIFDDYDDAAILKKYAYIGVDKPEISLETVRMLESMGVAEKSDRNQRGYLLKLQPFLRLLCGGIYQTRQWVEKQMDVMESKLSAIEQKMVTV